MGKHEDRTDWTAMGNHQQHNLQTGASRYSILKYYLPVQCSTQNIYITGPHSFTAINFISTGNDKICNKYGINQDSFSLSMKSQFTDFF